MKFNFKNQLCIILLIAILINFVAIRATKAEEPLVQEEINVYSLQINEATLFRGYTASIFDNKFRIGFFPSVLQEPTEIVFKEFLNPEKFLPLPTDQKIISNIFEFDIRNQKAYNLEKPLIIEIKYPSDSVNLKRINYWDKGKNRWVELPTKSILERGVVRAVIHLPYARLAVFEDPKILEVGQASWYQYKNCDCAASPDWPKGTKLKVINLETNESLIVTVNDFGPDRSVHPDRVIDLDLVAFKKIAEKWKGLIRVKVEKL
jgi:hypothetical protein